MARTYKRDSRGRFASGGGGGGRPAARGVSRGTNRLTRDNAGRITSVGGNGATARGGRLRTASGKQRATQTAKVSGGRAAGTVTRSGARRTAAAAAAATTPPSKLKRSGKTIKIAQKKAPTPTNTATIQAGARLQSSTGQWGTLKTNKSAKVLSERFGVYKVAINGKQYSVDYKNVKLSEQSGPKQRQGVIKRSTTRAAAAAVKPTRKSIGSINDAKASRIIARMDANRSGLRRATGTDRQTANSIRTRERAVNFALAPGARARKKGQSLSVNESLQRAVKNASKKRVIGGRRR